MENQRLWDLVRYARGYLFDTNLMDENEYAELLQHEGAVARLETYDGIRADLKNALDRVAALERELAEARKPCPCKVREAADLLDATTPRPWPPPAGVEKCLMWIGRDGWFTDCVEPWLRLPEEVQPDFWLPMPPEPEVVP